MPSPLQFMTQYRNLRVTVPFEDEAQRVSRPITATVQLRNYFLMKWKDGTEELKDFHEVTKVKGKNEWWVNNHEVHSSSVKGPFPNGDRFAVIFNYDVTAKAGPMAGQRMKMEEVALYTVKDGKITREEFFYTM